MIKYIIISMIFVLLYTLFIYWLIDDHYRHLKKEFSYEIKELENSQIKTIKDIFNSKQIDGTIEYINKGTTKLEAILVLRTHHILEIGETVTNGNRFLKITNIVGISNDWIYYDFKYIA